MTFSKTVKNELVTLPAKHNEMLAEFSAFLNLACDFHIENSVKMIDYHSTNPTVVKRFLLLSKTLYQAETTLLTKEQQTFTKKNLVVLRLSTEVDRIINEHDYLGNNIEALKLITRTDKEKISFLRGAFLVSGSVNHPKTSEYHLEFFVRNQKLAIFLQSIMNHFNFNARIAKRRDGFMIYLKSGEAISDFIQLLGTYNALFKFEDIRIQRDINSSINRLINIELANEKKSVKASDEQLEYIEIIRNNKMILNIDPKLEEIMELRIKYPEVSLSELTSLYEHEYGKEISRSGIRHRFNKIKELALKTKGED